MASTNRGIKLKKINQQYRLRQATGINWIVKTNQQEADYVPPFSVNECGALIWKEYEAGSEIDEISSLLQSQYGISSEEAIKDLGSFLEQLSSVGIII